MTFTRLSRRESVVFQIFFYNVMQCLFNRNPMLGTTGWNHLYYWFLYVYKKYRYIKFCLILSIKNIIHKETS